MTSNFFIQPKNYKIAGLVRDLNPGPLAPEARIIPLDQRARLGIFLNLSMPTYKIDTYILVMH